MNIPTVMLSSLRCKDVPHSYSPIPCHSTSGTVPLMDSRTELPVTSSTGAARRKHRRAAVILDPEAKIIRSYLFIQQTETALENKGQKTIYIENMEK